MTVLDPRPALADQPHRGHDSRVWGSTPLELHDRFWASQGVQVVRQGGMPIDERGPVLYLMLGPDELVSFELKPIVRQLHWSSPQLVRVRMTVPQDDGYREHVEAEADGSLVGIRRSYRHIDVRTARLWLTHRAEIATCWAEAESRREATDGMRKIWRTVDASPIRISGRLLRADKPADASAWMAIATKSWARQRAVFPGVFEYQSGVWMHESVEVDPSAVIVGPAWIGRGVSVGPGDVVVGPVAIPDRETHVPKPIDWSVVKSTHWSLPSLVGASRVRRVGKRTFDIVFSLLAIALTLPIYPLVMLAILIEDGRPFFFSHTRQTLGGRDFPCVKFRTMRRDAEAIKQRLIKENAVDGPQFFMKNDPRVLKIGRVLRKFQIDEFPQFFNVLAGHMSVVGPRPSPEKENQFCPAWREARLSVRPGITGLWQVKRTREPLTDFQEWIRYDLDYVNHQSMASDINIVVETAWQVAASAIAAVVGTLWRSKASAAAGDGTDAASAVESIGEGTQADKEQGRG